MAKRTPAGCIGRDTICNSFYSCSSTGLFSFYIGFGAIDPCQIPHIYSIAFIGVAAMRSQLSVSHRPPGQASTIPSLCSRLRAGAVHAGAGSEILRLFIA